MNLDLKRELDKYISKNVTISISGFFKTNYLLNNFNYFIKADILNMKDEENKNYTEINLNQVYNIQAEDKKIVLFLDNDIIISIY